MLLVFMVICIVVSFIFVFFCLFELSLEWEVSVGYKIIVLFWLIFIWWLNVGFKVLKNCINILWGRFVGVILIVNKVYG